MSCVFGPVRSRRLGWSLGVDPIPFKTCNWNCVYCQLGRSAPMIVDRADYFPPGDIVADVERALAGRGGDGIDWITFGGSGEPTLHAGLGHILRAVKVATRIPVAVLTNGSLLDRPDVRHDLLAADAVLPTLDAGSEAVYRAMIRPAPGWTLERLSEGLVAFRAVYRGNLWIEVMLVRGINDSDQALEDIAAVLRRIRPDEVHVNLPVRPPAEPWVEPPDARTVERAVAMLGASARVAAPAGGWPRHHELSHEGLADTVMGVIARHPVREQELALTLSGWAPGEVARALKDLESAGRARTVARYGQTFWTCASGRYAESPGPTQVRNERRPR